VSSDGAFVLPFQPLTLTISDQNRADANRLAEVRLSQSARWHSPHRITARNINSQIRGALGEIVLKAYLTDIFGSVNGSGSDDDDVALTDVSFPRGSFEIMTAQIRHREITGFCVPPGKFAAAKARSADGYVFVGTDSYPETRFICVQAWIDIGHIDTRPPRLTSVSESSIAVTNFVVEPQFLRNPRELFAL
jgi:hypothetical protein